MCAAPRTARPTPACRAAPPPPRPRSRRVGRAAGRASSARNSTRVSPRRIGRACSASRRSVRKRPSVHHVERAERDQLADHAAPEPRRPVARRRRRSAAGRAPSASPPRSPRRAARRRCVSRRTAGRCGYTADSTFCASTVPSNSAAGVAQLSQWPQGRAELLAEAGEQRARCGSARFRSAAIIASSRVAHHLLLRLGRGRLARASGAPGRCPRRRTAAACRPRSPSRPARPICW